MTDAAKIAEELTSFERERLIEWQGPPGAAFNATSAFLQKLGLLHLDWSLTPAGEAVRAHLLKQENRDG